jgi:rubrerythrin
MRFPSCRRLGALAAGVAWSSAAALAVSGAPASAQSPPADQLLISAARTESAAFLQYNGYAAEADRTGRTNLADVWRTVAKVEHQDHWTGEVTTAGFYSATDNLANLKLAITQARQTAQQDRAFAAKKPNSSAAQVLRQVAARETHDASLLSEALRAAEGTGSIPAAPAVTKVKVVSSPQPKFSGTFYNDLTSGSSSALEQAAWLWAEYQYIGQTAVNTGQASLAALLGGLENQEAQQNWEQIANVAGYVNGNASNLTSSIASEAGAIQMYTNFAQQATTDGNPTIASMFNDVKGDEQGHHATFTAELKQVKSGRGR